MLNFKCFAIGNPTGRNSYFRIHHRDVMLGGDVRDYRAMLARELERRHAPVAKQVTARIVIERQIDDERAREVARVKAASVARYAIRNVNAPELTSEDVAANAHAYAGDHVAAARDRMDDTRDYLTMRKRAEHPEALASLYWFPEFHA